MWRSCCDALARLGRLQVQPLCCLSSGCVVRFVPLYSKVHGFRPLYIGQCQIVTSVHLSGVGGIAICTPGPSQQWRHKTHLSRCRPVNGNATGLDCEGSVATSEEDSNDSPTDASSRFPRIVGVPALPPISPPGRAPTTTAITNQPRVVDTCDSVSSPSAAQRSRSQSEADAAAAQALRQHYSAAAAPDGSRLRQLQKQLALRDVELQQARERIQACRLKLHSHLYSALQLLRSARHADRPMVAASH